MKIVIDIPEEAYNEIHSLKYLIHGLKSEENRQLFYQLINTINDGTPLPEHHGRLIDADALEEYFRNVRKELKASDYKNGIEFFVRDEMLLNVQQFIHLCDAIIEGSDNK